MKRFGKLLRVAAHPRELRLALSGLAMRIAGEGDFGGLSADETAFLVETVRRCSAAKVVEIGTLFGFTARALAATGAEVVAVDNFCWNPFGLTPAEHRAFTLRVLELSGVTLVESDAIEFLARPLGPETFVFLDGDHRYEAVKREIELARDAGARWIACHDWKNDAFGVTAAFLETLGKPDAEHGRIAVKKV